MKDEVAQTTCSCFILMLILVQEGIFPSRFFYLQGVPGQSQTKVTVPCCSGPLLSNIPSAIRVVSVLFCPIPDNTNHSVSSASEEAHALIVPFPKT